MFTKLLLKNRYQDYNSCFYTFKKSIKFDIGSFLAKWSRLVALVDHKNKTLFSKLNNPVGRPDRNIKILQVKALYETIVGIPSCLSHLE